MMLQPQYPTTEKIKTEPPAGGWPGLSPLKLRVPLEVQSNGKSKASTNHRSVNCRSGIIGSLVESVVGNTDAKDRAARLPTLGNKRQQ
jgi:hypothetical protein